MTGLVQNGSAAIDSDFGDEGGDVIMTNNVDDGIIGGDDGGRDDDTNTHTHTQTNTNTNTMDGDGDTGADGDVRTGTISSARFNILSTMVGGGCLSLPMAFQQSGNALIGPIMLLVTGVITDFCFRSLVASAVHLHKPHRNSNRNSNRNRNRTTTRRPGKDTFESLTSEAFGPTAYVFSMGLVVLMCFFGTVGYCVLLRDMMQPLNGAIAPHFFSEWGRHNFTMFLVIFLVTPFCTLRRLTALKDCGAASMISILILGSCIVFRSVQCNCNKKNGDDDEQEQEPWYTHLTFFPESWRDLLNALPLYISCFVCHYNILPVHNELKDPSPARISWWLGSTTWFAVALYMIMGFAGSAYAHCTPTGKIQGNILLDFDENDPLLMVGRMCLAVTITLAFPMLVIPGRDIVVRSLILPRLRVVSTAAASSPHLGSNNESRELASASATPTATATATAGQHDNRAVTRSVDEELQEPLLTTEEFPREQQQQQQHQQQSMEISDNAAADDDDEEDLSPHITSAGTPVDDVNGISNSSSGGGGDCDDLSSASTTVLLCTSVVIFWSAGTVASVVSSIDVVWDLLGSSLSILLSYLIPAGTFLVITKRQQQQQQDSNDDWLSRAVCWLLIWIFVPLMVISTGNAIVNTFL